MIEIVTSAKGGVGKSTVAKLLSWVHGELKTPDLHIVDLDNQMDFATCHEKSGHNPNLIHKFNMHSGSRQVKDEYINWLEQASKNNWNAIINTGANDPMMLDLGNTYSLDEAFLEELLAVMTGLQNIVIHYVLAPHYESTVRLAKLWSYINQMNPKHKIKCNVVINHGIEGEYKLEPKISGKETHISKMINGKIINVIEVDKTLLSEIANRRETYSKALEGDLTTLQRIRLVKLLNSFKTELGV